MSLTQFAEAIANNFALDGSPCRTVAIVELERATLKENTFVFYFKQTMRLKHTVEFSVLDDPEELDALVYFLRQLGINSAQTLDPQYVLLHYMTEIIKLYGTHYFFIFNNKTISRNKFKRADKITK